MESAAAGLVEDTLTPDDQLWVGRGGGYVNKRAIAKIGKRFM